MRSFLGRDILSLKDFERADFERVFEICDELAPIAQHRRNTDLLAGQDAADGLLPAEHAHADVDGGRDAPPRRSRARLRRREDDTRAGDFYQESMKDTIHMLEFYADVIAMRHFQQGAPAEAAHWASIPIINCGDGWGEHPTQVLTDLYTIKKELGTLDGLTFLLVGDMRMRTMHSILYALSQFDAKAYVVGPPEMSLLPEFKARARRAATSATRRRESTEDVIAECDVIYMEPVVQADYTQSRVERERRRRLGDHAETYQVTRELLREKAKTGSIILHSLPRMDELPSDVDETRHAALLAGGVQRRRAPDGAPLARARRDGVVRWSFTLNGEPVIGRAARRREPARGPPRGASGCAR